MDLAQSDDCFVMAFPAETTEAFLEGHNHAFAYFGGVQQSTQPPDRKVARSPARSARWRVCGW
jgi:transposase